MTPTKPHATTVPGTVRGILLQATRFLYYLLVVDPDDIVSLELLDDVAVEHQDGATTAEQDKSIFSSNPLADRSVHFWKTLHNWIDSASARTIAPNHSRFILYAPRAQMGPIARAFHDATATSDAIHALRRARQLLVDDDALRISIAARPHVEAVLRANSNLTAQVIQRFQVDADDHPEDALRAPLLDKLVGPDSFDHVVTWAQGWVKRKIDHFVELGQPARIRRREFHSALLTYVRLHDRTNILRSVAGMPTDLQVAEQLSMRTYVTQLKIIDLNDIDIFEAVNDFLSASVDRTTWSDQGMISEASLQRLERELTLTWRNKSRRVSLSHSHHNATAQGQLTYTDCMEHDAKVDDLETPKTFIRGSWHALAEDLTIGWRPDYKAALAAFRDTPQSGDEE